MKCFKFRNIKLLLWTIIFFVLTACSAQETPSLMKMGVLPNDGHICNVAILPFTNQTKYHLGDMITYRVFVSEITKSGNYLVAQEGDIRNIYREMSIITGQVPNVEQLRVMAGRLGAQIVITATVVEMQDKSGGGQLEPSLAMIFRVIEGETGRTMWTTYHRREGADYRKVLHFGVVNTITSLAQKISHEVLQKWQEGGLQTCEAD